MLRGAELEHYQRLFERNRVEHERYWKDGVYVYQRSNYDAVFTQPEWDGLVRHPGVLPIVEGLMGAPVCLGENSLREMGPAAAVLLRTTRQTSPPPRESSPGRIDNVHLTVSRASILKNVAP